MPHNLQTNKQGALRFSIRISGAVTSLSLRRNLVSLWLSLANDNIESLSKEKLNEEVLNFIYKSLSNWKQDNGKGLSDYISECMILDILEEEDQESYQKVLNKI